MKVGIFIDCDNIRMNGGINMDYNVLRDFACRDGAEPVFLNAYTRFDPEHPNHKFHNYLRGCGFRPILKEVQWYTNEFGERYGKANADLDLAMDVVFQSDRLNRILLLTGDGDFSRLISAVHSKGVRVEVLAFDNISQSLIEECDLFTNGYLVPSLLYDRKKGPPWGEHGSTVRGYCCHFDIKKKEGYLKYLNDFNANILDYHTDREGSPYRDAHFKSYDLPADLDLHELFDQRKVFEFTLKVLSNGKLAADHVRLLSDELAREEERKKLSLRELTDEGAMDSRIPSEAGLKAEPEVTKPINHESPPSPFHKVEQGLHAKDVDNNGLGVIEATNLEQKIGKVVEIFSDKGFGFMETENGEVYYFHVYDFVENVEFTNIAEGDLLEFSVKVKPCDGIKGRGVAFLISLKENLSEVS